MRQPCKPFHANVLAVEKVVGTEGILRGATCAFGSFHDSLRLALPPWIRSHMLNEHVAVFVLSHNNPLVASKFVAQRPEFFADG